MNIGIPTYSGKDPAARACFDSMRQILQILLGQLGAPGEAAITKAELKAAGLIGYDATSGAIFKPKATPPPFIAERAIGTNFGPQNLVMASLDVGSALAAGTHDLDLILPSGAVVTYAWYDVLTAFAGAGTISMGIATDAPAGILAATTLAAGFTTGRHVAIPTGAVATFTTKTTTTRSIILTNSGALTAGRLNLFLAFSISQ